MAFRMFRPRASARPWPSGSPSARPSQLAVCSLRRHISNPATPKDEITENLLKLPEMKNKEGETIWQDAKWVADEIIKDLPKWYLDRLRIVSVGPGWGHSELILSKFLRERGATIDRFVLIEPDIGMVKIASYIEARSVEVWEKKLEECDLPKAETFDVAVFFSSLHFIDDWTHTLSNLFFLPGGVSLGFIQGNKAGEYYSTPGVGMDRVRQHLKTHPLRPAITLTDHELTLHIPTPQGTIHDEDVYLGKISRLNRDPTYDTIMAHKRNGYGPGYD